MSRSTTHSRCGNIRPKSLARVSNAFYKRLRMHRERTQLRNELADLSRYEEDLDREFTPWDKRMAKHVGYWWY